MTKIPSPRFAVNDDVNSFRWQKRKVFPFFVFQRIFHLPPSPTPHPHPAHCDCPALFVVVETKLMLGGPEVFGWNFRIDSLAKLCVVSPCLLKHRRLLLSKFKVFSFSSLQFKPVTSPPWPAGVAIVEYTNYSVMM